MLRTLVALSSIELPLGLLVLVLNVIFIFFGRNTGWYYFVDSLGTELKVVSTERKTHYLDRLGLSRRHKDKYVPQISVGEGIVSGLLYLALSATSLAILLRVIFKRNLHTVWFLLCIHYNVHRRYKGITFPTETWTRGNPVLHQVGDHLHCSRSYHHHQLPGCLLIFCINRFFFTFTPKRKERVSF